MFFGSTKIIKYAFIFVCIETIFISDACDGVIPWVIHHKDEAKLVRRHLRESVYDRLNTRRKTEQITTFLQEYVHGRLKSLRVKVTYIFPTIAYQLIILKMFNSISSSTYLNVHERE